MTNTQSVRFYTEEKAKLNCSVLQKTAFIKTCTMIYGKMINISDHSGIADVKGYVAYFENFSRTIITEHDQE